MKKILIHIVDIIKILIAMIVIPILKIFNKDSIYLIGERKDQCQDNGYHLFKYIRQNHPETKVYYCITKDSKQLNKIKYLGNIIYHGTVKHYMYYIMASKIVVAHLGSCDPESPLIWKMESKGKIKKHKLFIQHGIIVSEYESFKYENSSVNIFVCGAKPEFDYINENFGYKSGTVKYLGLCRFDNLYNYSVKNQILLMPTWRSCFGSTWGAKSDDKFLISDYYFKFQSLINNKGLIKYLKDNNMELIFYPHHEMQRYLKYFRTECNLINIAESDKYDVQELLKESKILITDYSSIAFDFAYMKKPILYYQFDKDLFYLNHCKKGYFDYKSDGFGQIVVNEDELLNELKVLKNVNQNEKYDKRINRFFPLHDQHNCKRHYEEIIRLDSK